MKRFLAIDPGASGGFAWRDINGKVTVCPMPPTEEIVVMTLRHLQQIDLVLIEHVGGYMPGKFTPGSGMFNFGCGYGIIKGAMIAFGMEFKVVAPHKWQTDLGMGRKKDFEKGWKNHLKEEAQAIYPGIKVTLKTADALLMLNYAEQFL